MLNLIIQNTERIIFIMEIIGTIAFASSGALTALRHNMDIFGVNVLAIVTAVGGGMLRDLFIGNIPPVMFRQPIYAVTAMVTCNLLFLVFYINRKLLVNHFIIIYEKIMLILDAIGLGIFTVAGIHTGMISMYHDNRFLILFLGVLTGVGGGVIRDILATQKPYILHKHVYASASILGAIVCIFLWPFGDVIAMWAGALTVILIRFLAIRFHWNLPRLQ